MAAASSAAGTGHTCCSPEQCTFSTQPSVLILWCRSTQLRYSIHMIDMCATRQTSSAQQHRQQCQCPSAQRTASALEVRSISKFLHGAILRGARLHGLRQHILCPGCAVQTVTKRGVGGSSFVAGYRRILTPDDSLEAHTMLGVHSQDTAESSGKPPSASPGCMSHQETVVTNAMCSSLGRPKNTAAAAKHAAAGGACVGHARDHMAAGPGLRAAAGHRAAAVDALAR